MADSPDDKSYRVEDGQDADEEQPKQRGPTLERSGAPEPVPLEDEDDIAASIPDEPIPDEPISDEPISDEPIPDEPIPDEPDAIKALDVCPNCGSPMPGTGTLVCLRCGFNLKTLKVTKVQTGVTTAPDEDEDDDAEEKREPIVKKGKGELWLPGIVAAGAGVALLFGYLSGSAGLFGGEEIPAFGGRFTALLGALVLVAILAGCGLGALAFTARYMMMGRLGDAALAAMRMLGIVAAMRLMSFISMPHQSVEWMLEFAAQAAIFVGLTTLFFSIKPRDAAIVGGGTLAGFFALLVVSATFMWAVFP